MQQSQRAFTLIELLVVVVIISILVAIGIGNYIGSVDESKYAAAEADMATLKKSMLEYKVFHGELPLVGFEVNTVPAPIPTPTVTPSPNNTWVSVVDALVLSGDLGERIDNDPWGNPYYYRDSDCNATNPGQSILITSGPDGTVGNTDDFQMVVSEGCLFPTPTPTLTPIPTP